MRSVLAFLGDLVTDLFNFNLPWGLSFGVAILTVVSLPLAFKLFKRFF